MAWALIASLVFSLGYAALAAKSRQAEKILIPLLDVLQSVPILGFLSITVTGFIALFPGSLLGVECAAIFAIFTSQAWNMTFSVYQSLRTVPGELIEAARMYHLSPWRRFWRLEVPHAMPSLVWNMMMSVSGGWFFVVASEAITVAGHTILLPGVGSYIAVAIEKEDLAAIGWAVLVMFIVILLYDQLLFRPLIAWSRKFKPETSPDEDTVRPWFLIMLQRARFFELVQAGLLALNRWLDQRFAGSAGAACRPAAAAAAGVERLFDVRFSALSLAAGAWLVVLHPRPGRGVRDRLGVRARPDHGGARAGADRAGVAGLGADRGVRSACGRASPTGRSRSCSSWRRSRPICSFPAAVVLIVRFHLNPEIWLSPLMILGTQWYILFNVIAGAAALPTDFSRAAQISACRAGCGGGG